MTGAANSVVEVADVSKDGFWLHRDTDKLLVTFEFFPSFRNATREQPADVQRPAPKYLYWPQLDADVSVESIRDPKAFPLVAKDARC